MNGEESRKFAAEEELKPDYLRQGYSLKQLRSFNEYIKKHDPRKAIATMESWAQQGRQTETNVLSPDEQNKLERFAIAGHYLQEIWKNMMSWSEAHDGGIGRVEDNNLIPVSASEIKDELADHPSPDDGVVKILAQYEDYFIDQFLDESSKLDVSSPKGKIFARYKKILSERKDEAKDLSVRDVLAGAAAQSRILIWSLFRAVPKVYRKNYYQAPSFSEVSEIVDNAKPLLVALSSTSAIIGSRIEYIANGSQHGGFDVNDFNSLYFNIAESTNGQKFLEFDPRLFESLKEDFEDLSEEELNSLETGVGCPALYVKGQKGGSIVSEFYDMNADWYKKYVLPLKFPPKK